MVFAAFPCITGKPQISSFKIFRTWKVLENEAGPFWNLIVVQINQWAKFGLLLTELK